MFVFIDNRFLFFHFFGWEGGRGGGLIEGGALIRGGRLFIIIILRRGAYSREALIRGGALNRGITVF